MIFSTSHIFPPVSACAICWSNGLLVPQSFDRIQIRSLSRCNSQSRYQPTQKKILQATPRPDQRPSPIPLASWLLAACRLPPRHQNHEQQNHKLRTEMDCGRAAVSGVLWRAKSAAVCAQQVTGQAVPAVQTARAQALPYLSSIFNTGAAGVRSTQKLARLWPAGRRWRAADARRICRVISSPPIRRRDAATRAGSRRADSLARAI